MSDADLVAEPAPAGSVAPETIDAPPPPPPRQLAIQVAGLARAIEVALVREVMRVAAITRVPHAPPHVLGLTALRGRLIPVIDVGVVVDGRPGTVDPHARIVVVALGGRVVGLLVERVGGVVVGDAALLDLDALVRGN